jgi:nucleoside-diphosphate-sugar epimerase
MKALVLGAGGFIGNNLVKRLKSLQYEVVGVDIKKPVFEKSLADTFIIADLRLQENIQKVFFTAFDEVYQFAADMGGAGYVFTGEHDAAIMYNSMQINLNVAEGFRMSNSKKLFFASSACVYPLHNQLDSQNPVCTEDTVYPANPDSEYGWEKLLAERLFMNYAKNYGLAIKIARFHNIYGEGNPFNDGKEKAPAAISRKVLTTNNGEIEIWGNGQQTRTFLYIDDCLDAVLLLMQSEVNEPVNIGSEELISINDLALLSAQINQKNITLKHIEGPLGVPGRCSDNRLIFDQLKWKPKYSLLEGMTKLNDWVKMQLKNV